MVGQRPLSGRRVVTTRDERGRLDSLLAAAGADVVHVALIALEDAPDRDGALAAALDGLAAFDWLVVTSRHGADRVGAAAALHPGVQLAAVGPRTADRLAELAGRAVAVVPDRHTAAALLDAMPGPVAEGRRVVLVQADLADDSLSAGLSDKGFDVTAVVGYVTRLRVPTPAERAAVATADAVAFASGSAARAWAAAFGSWAPPVVVAIGPTTRQVAVEAGLEVTHTAAVHTVDGVVREITSIFGRRP